MEDRKHRLAAEKYLSLLLALIFALGYAMPASLAEDAAPNTVTHEAAVPTGDSGTSHTNSQATKESIDSSAAAGCKPEENSAATAPVSDTTACAPTSETVLPNGLKVIFLQDHAFPVVSCLSWYRVGARNESPGLTGISHVLEHLLFGEVGSFRRGEIAATIARNGGQFNGYTSDDFTTFFETLPAAKLELALKIESERMRRAVFTDRALKEEVANVEREMDADAVDGSASLSREVRALLFQAHPYHNPTIGWRNDIENITVQDLTNYYDRFYCPNNCTIVIAGDVKPRVALSVVQKYFGNLPRSAEPIPSVRVVEPEQKGERRAIVKYAGKQETLQVAYHVPGLDDADAPALVVLQRMLNSAYSGRLKTKLTANKICFQAISSFEAKKDPGFFSITCQAMPGTHDSEQKICDSLDDLIQQLKSQPPTEAEMRRARNLAELAYFTEQDGPYRAGFLLGYFETLSSWHKAVDWPQRLRSVSAADIQRVVKRYFNQDNRVVAWLSSPPPPHPATPASKPGSEGNGSTTRPTQVHSPDHARMTGYKDNDAALAPNKKQSFKYVLAEKIDQPYPEDQSADSPNDTKPAPSIKSAGVRAVGKVIGAIPEALPAAVKQLPQAVESVPTVIKSIPSAIEGIPTVVKELPSVVTGIPSAVKQIPGAIGSIPGAAVSAVKELPGAAATTIKELPGALGAMPGATANALKGMPMAIGSVAAQIGTVPGAIGKTLTQERGDKSPISRRVLRNGIRLVVFESHTVPVVQIAGAFPAGSAYEPTDRPGISAVTASVLNQGSATRGRNQASLQEEDLGLVPSQMLHFRSTADSIAFTTSCLRRDLPAQLALLADTLTSPASQDSDIERAKQEAVSQLKQADDSLESRAERALLRSVLADSSPFVPHEPWAVAKSVASLQPDAVRKFMSDHIVPGGATIVIAGDIDADSAAAAIESGLRNWASKGAPQRVHARANARHVLRTSIPVRDKTKAAIAFGELLSVSPSTPDFANLLIADALLSKHPVFSRLSRKLAADPQLSGCFDNQDFEARLQPLSNSTAWSFICAVEPNVVPLAVSTLRSEMNKLSEEGIRPEELAEMKRYLLGSLPVSGFSTLPKAADTLLQTSMNVDEGQSLFAELTGIRNATVDSVNKFIRSALNPRDCTLVVVGAPQAIKELRSHSDISSVGGGLTGAAAGGQSKDAAAAATSGQSKAPASEPAGMRLKESAPSLSGASNSTNSLDGTAPSKGAEASNADQPSKNSAMEAPALQTNAAGNSACNTPPKNTGAYSQ